MIFKRKPKFEGYFIIIDFTNQAREFAVGFDFCKKIKHYYNGNLYKVEPYSEERVAILKKDLVPIIDLTIGQEVPKDSILQPKLNQVFGTIQITKRVW